MPIPQPECDPTNDPACQRLWLDYLLEQDRLRGGRRNRSSRRTNRTRQSRSTRRR